MWQRKKGHIRSSRGFANNMTSWCIWHVESKIIWCFFSWLVFVCFCDFPFRMVMFKSLLFHFLTLPISTREWMCRRAFKKRGSKVTSKLAGPQDNNSQSHFNTTVGEDKLYKSRFDWLFRVCFFDSTCTSLQPSGTCSFLEIRCSRAQNYTA